MMKIKILLKLAISFLLLLGLVALPIACGGDDPEPPPVVMQPEPKPTPTPDPNNNNNNNNGDDDDAREFEAVTPNLNDGSFDFENQGNPFLAGEKISPSNEGGNWGIFGNGSNAADSDFLTVEYADNPSKSGINTSDRVLKITEQAGNAPWSGFFFDLEEVVVFPDGMNAISVHIYSIEPGQEVEVKIEDATDNTKNVVSKVKTTKNDEWEQLIFNFASENSGLYDRIAMVMNHAKTNDAETTYYLDNVAFATPKEMTDDGGGGDTDSGSGAEATSPNDSAPTPGQEAESVLSVFSDAYTNIENVDFNPDWGQQTTQTFEDVTDGDRVLKYENLNYQGIEFKNEAGDGNTPVDVSSYQSIHLDYWVSNSTKLQFFLINSALQTGANPAEKPFDLDVSKVSQWMSVDIPLSHFSDVVDLSKVDQFKFDGDGTVYIDNLYFHGEGDQTSPPPPPVNVVNPPTAAPSSPKHPADMVLSIFSDTYDDLQDTDFHPSWGQATQYDGDFNIDGNSILKYSNLNYQGIALKEDGGQADREIDVTNYTHIHLDYYVVSAVDLRFFLISTGPKEIPVSLDLSQKGQWINLDIPLSEFTTDDETSVDLTRVFQFKIDEEMGMGSGAEIYFDNIYFHGTSLSPQESAPEPTLSSDEVVSIFSDPYGRRHPITGLLIDGAFPTVPEFIMPFGEEDQILKHSNIPYQAIQINPSLDASDKTHFHLDYWVATSTELQFSIISVLDDVTHEVSYELDTSQKEQWIRVDVPLEDFKTETGTIDWKLINQFKIEGNGTAYFDNLYFYGRAQDDTMGMVPPCEFETVTPNLNDVSFDFECQGPSFSASDQNVGEGGTWGRFGPGSNAPESDFLTLEYVDNPNQSGINTSSRVLKITEQSGNAPWSGFFFELEEKITFPSGMNAISIQVWSQEPGQRMELKLQELGNAENHENPTVTTTETEAWENLIFEFSASNSGEFNQIVMVMNHAQTNSAEVSYYIDHIAFTNPKGTVDSGSSQEPTQAAPNPTRSADDVISIFSDAYTDVENVQLNPQWGQSTTVTRPTLSGNEVLKYENLNYQGIEFRNQADNGNTPIDVSSYTGIHLDYWVSNASRLSIDLINSVLQTGTENAVEKLRELDVSKGNQWVPVDIPLSHFSDVVDLSQVDQLKFEGDNTVYIDNIYFYKE
ncbi:MAG: hypothetical protein OXC61_11600 [Flavobacteriaceae bacterium]|nr:hypothetical protein [Flavobacteriaceae bacterium]